MNKQKHKAFTLVELIIVVTILAILGAISFVSFKGYTKNTRDSNRLSTFKTIEKGLSLYNIGAGKYPKPNGELSTGIIESKELTYVGEIGEEIQRIIKSNKLPKDPLTGNNYIYGTTLDYKNYEIATILESDIISQSILFKKAYAGNTDNIKSKVNGDYPGYIKYSSGTNVYLANIPSIIFNNTGSIDLLSTGTYYIRNKGKNLPYGVNGTKKSEDIQKINAEVLMREITNYPSATLQTVNITEILNKTKSVEEVFTGGVEKSFNTKGIDTNETQKIIQEIETIIEGKSTSKEEVVVTNGNCGASDGKYMMQKPTTGLCNTGTPTTINGTGPWTWSCESPDTGTSTSCTTNKLGEVSEGTHSTTQTGIVWNYTIPTGANKVEISLDGSTWIDNSLNTNYNENSLTCGTSYTGRKLRACDSNGDCTSGIILSSTSTSSCPTNGIVTYNSGRRWSNGTYAASCNSYRNPSSGYSYSGDTGDGQYYIDPDGSGGNSEFLVYCDMTTDGGGWTAAWHTVSLAVVGTDFSSAGGSYSAINWNNDGRILLKPLSDISTQVTFSLLDNSTPSPMSNHKIAYGFTLPSNNMDWLPQNPSEPYNTNNCKQVSIYNMITGAYVQSLYTYDKSLTYAENLSYSSNRWWHGARGGSDCVSTTGATGRVGIGFNGKSTSLSIWNGSGYTSGNYGVMWLR